MGYRTPWAVREATMGCGTLRGGEPEEMGYRTPWGGRCGAAGYRTPWGSGGPGGPQNNWRRGEYGHCGSGEW